MNYKDIITAGIAEAKRPEIYSGGDGDMKSDEKTADIVGWKGAKWEGGSIRMTVFLKKGAADNFIVYRAKNKENGKWMVIVDTNADGKKFTSKEFDDQPAAKKYHDGFKNGSL